MQLSELYTLMTMFLYLEFVIFGNNSASS